jgi:hypothetical protein
LSSIIDPFIESFDENPLPTGVAEATFHRLLEVVRDVEEAISSVPERQIDALNRLAAVELV